MNMQCASRLTEPMDDAFEQSPMRTQLYSRFDENRTARNEAKKKTEMLAYSVALGTMSKNVQNVNTIASI